MELIFDTHAHYDDKAFGEDREEVLSGLSEHGVGMVVDVSASMESIPEVLSLAGQYDFIYAAVGVHPTETYELETGDIARVEMYATASAAGEASGESSASTGNMTNKVVAIGEIGLDYHYPDTQKEKQKEWFAMQIDLAKRLRLPIIVHSRDAAQDTLELIKAENAKDAGGVLHCFSYEPEMAKIYTDMGFYIGIGGVVTFKNARKLKEIAAQMPMELMLLETDCPYLAPEPFRGRRNDSAMIHYVAETIAVLRGMSPEDVIRITTENARRFYGL